MLWEFSTGRWEGRKAEQGRAVGERREGGAKAGRKEGRGGKGTRALSAAFQDQPSPGAPHLTLRSDQGLFLSPVLN